MYTCPKCGSHDVYIEYAVIKTEHWYGDHVEVSELQNCSRNNFEETIECVDCGYKSGLAENWLDDRKGECGQYATPTLTLHYAFSKNDYTPDDIADWYYDNGGSAFSREAICALAAEKFLDQFDDEEEFDVAAIDEAFAEYDSVYDWGSSLRIVGWDELTDDNQWDVLEQSVRFVTAFNGDKIVVTR